MTKKEFELFQNSEVMRHLKKNADAEFSELLNELRSSQPDEIISRATEYIIAKEVHQVVTNESETLSPGIVDILSKTERPLKMCFEAIQNTADTMTGQIMLAVSKELLPTYRS